MPKKFKDTSARLSTFDYSSEGVYFITICTKDQFPFFGKVLNWEMHLSPVGEIVKGEWLKTSEIRKKEKVTLDAYCIMPNHLHALLIIGNPHLPEQSLHVPHTVNHFTRFGYQSQTLGSIVRGFKGACTRKIREIEPTFTWQSLFYDHIIRDQRSLRNIQNYIRNNPAKWHLEKNL